MLQSTFNPPIIYDKCPNIKGFRESPDVFHCGVDEGVGFAFRVTLERNGDSSISDWGGDSNSYSDASVPFLPTIVLLLKERWLIDPVFPTRTRDEDCDSEEGGGGGLTLP